jgi:hypothetical protein
MGMPENDSARGEREKAGSWHPGEEMTIGDLKRELRRFVRKIGEIDKLEKEDSEIKELLGPGPLGGGFMEVIAMIGFLKILLLFAKYFDIPPDLLQFKPEKENRTWAR